MSKQPFLIGSVATRLALQSFELVAIEYRRQLAILAAQPESLAAEQRAGLINYLRSLQQQTADAIATFAHPSVPRPASDPLPPTPRTVAEPIPSASSGPEPVEGNHQR